MSYRKFSTYTWQDKRFEKLEPIERYLFIYLWTNDICNQAGMYEITLRRIQFDTKVSPRDLEGALKVLAPMVEYDTMKEVVWIKSFLKNQCQNKDFARSAINYVMARHPENLQAFININKKLFLKYDLLAEINKKLAGKEHQGGLVLGSYPTEQNRTEQNRN